MPTRVQSIWIAHRGVLDDGRMLVLLQRCRNAEDHQGDGGGDIGVQHVARIDAVDPHHGGGGVAHHAAGAAGVGGGDDGGEIADMHLVAEDDAGDGAADQRGGDVVEKAGEHEDHRQQHEAAFPVVRQVARKRLRHVAFLEMARQQCEAQQQAEQIDQHHPFVAHVRAEAGDTGAVLEAGEDELVGRDGGQPRERHLQRVVVEQGDAQQRQAEQDEIDGDAEQRRTVAGRKRRQGIAAQERGNDQASCGAQPAANRRHWVSARVGVVHRSGLVEVPRILTPGAGPDRVREGMDSTKAHPLAGMGP